MAEEYAISRGVRDCTDRDARLGPFDESTVRAALLARGLDLDLEGADEGVLEAGDGSVFWQVELVRDEADRVVVLAGDMYYDIPHSPDAARLMHEAIRELAAAFDATAWVYPGPRVLEDDEVAFLLGS